MPNNNTVPQERINHLLDESEIQVSTIFDKCTVVACRLPNGYILMAHSACVDPANYDYEMGEKICMQDIENQLWAYEGYLLQSKQN